MKTQTDFFKNSIHKMDIKGINNINLKYDQLPTVPKNTSYGKKFLNSSKNKSNKRYYLNNNDRIIPITKPSKIKSFSTTDKKPVRSNTNFYLSNINFYNSGSLMKNDEINNINNLKNFNINNRRYNKYSSSTTVPKNNTLYKIKKNNSNPFNFTPNLKKIKLKNNNSHNINDLNNYNISNNNNITNYNKNNNNFNNYNYNIYLNQGISLERLLNENYSMYQEAKHSSNSFGYISAYGVNTYRGIFRNYNEDRVSIVVNAKYPKKTNGSNNDLYPNVSFFGIYDGHAGNKCSEYLKNNLHHCIFNSIDFPNVPIKAIAQGFKVCEHNYIKSIHNKTRNQYNDYSGSCAIIILIIDDMCYIANLGDSRALYSYDTGSKLYQLSRDHKPNDPKEKKRIYKAGGSIFKANLSQYGFPFSIKESDLGFKIPFRIIPGRLAVSIFLII